ncbi:MAG: PAS domain S-box protein, partial [Candidatus Hermodarchaeota archaeon]
MNENQNKPLLSNESFQKIFKLFPNPSYIWKKVEDDFILSDFNIAAELITNGEIRKFLGIKASEFHKKDPKILKDINQCFDDKKKIIKEMEYTFKTTEIEKILNITYDFVPPNLVLIHTEDITKNKKAELKLKESEERFRILLDKAVPAFTIHDLDGNILMVNDLTVKLLGYSRDELLQMNAKDIAYEIVPMEHRRQYWEKLAIGEHVETTGMHRRKDGTIYPAEIKLVKILFKDQPVIAAFPRDISNRIKEEQELKGSEEMYRMISENANDMISILDGEAKFTYCNEAFKRILGYEPKELIGMLVFKLIHPEDLNKTYQSLKKLSETGLSKEETRIRCKDGSYKWLESIGKGIFDKDKNLIKLIVISRDITDRKKTEQKLKESEKKYRVAYNRAEFYKDLFTHDMNNILQVVSSSNQLSIAFIDDINKQEKMKEMFMLIDKQVDRGGNLISNIRKLSELEHDKIFTQPTEFLPILSDTRETILESYHEKKITIEIENPYDKILIQANEFMKDVVINILTNSVLHNDNSIIKILIKIFKVQKEKKNYYKFEFIDNGRGIPEDFKKD